MAKKKENYLDFIPVVNGQNTWDRGEDGVVTIHMVNRGFYNTLAQKLFHTPREVTSSWMSTAASSGCGSMASRLWASWPWS